MSKQIIILERTSAADSYDHQYVFWATVPEPQQSYYADETFVSVYHDATSDEVAALHSGAVVEQAGNMRALSLSASATLDEIKAALIIRFNEFQNRINNFNPYDQYGVYYDGTTWVIPD